MNIATVKETLEKAAQNLFQNQPNIFSFTSETGQTEWNLAHHFANEVHKLFESFDCDIELIKPNLKNMRPDIVLHKRGTHVQNLLVVEVKRDGALGDINADVEKIRRYWFREPLWYQLGAVVNLKSKKQWEVHVHEGKRSDPKWMHEEEWGRPGNRSKKVKSCR